MRELEDVFDATRVLNKRLDQLREDATVRETEKGDAPQADANSSLGGGHRSSLSISTIETSQSATVPETDDARKRASTSVPPLSMASLSISHFETELDASWVYRKVKRPTSMFSFSSSAIDSHAWSVFSGITLADISIISVIALPLYKNDVRNPQHYTFGTIQEETSEPERETPSFYEECMMLRSGLSQISEIQENIEKLAQELGEPSNSPLLLRKWFKTDPAMRLLYATLATGLRERNLMQENDVIPAEFFKDRIDAAYHLIKACTDTDAISVEECFTVRDVFSTSYIGFRKVRANYRCNN